MQLFEAGHGQPVFLLHGGGGPATVASLAVHLAGTHRVVAPTLPGWNGTPRPAELDSVAALADELARTLAAQDLRNVAVIGSSIGGWLGAELALRDPAHRITRLAILNGGGLDVPGHPIANVFGLPLPELAKLSFHDPAKLVVPPASPEQLAILRGNQASLAAIAGTPYMHDPTLLGRLPAIHIPTLVVWGASDRVIPEAHGRAYAAAIAGARFELVAEAGHLPHLEQPAVTFALLDRFLASA